MNDPAPAPVAATGLTALSFRLTRARLAGDVGEGLLYGASVLAAAVCSVVTYTLAGGTWMFHRRQSHPSGLLAELLADDSFRRVLAAYVGLAALACALVLPALVSLIAAGARLGARGRERRLAALRLLGLSSGDITRMALLDSAVQSVTGTVIGFLLYLSSLPLWSGTPVQAVPIGSGEMMLPAALSAVVAVLLVAVGLCSAAWGLRRVRISPLGVARRENRPAVRIWRLAVAAAVVAIAVVAAPDSLVADNYRGLFVAGAVVVGFIAAVDLAGPWYLQAIARLMARLPWPVAITAARRTIADPTATWRRVATLGILAFCGGYLSLTPFTYDLDVARSAAEVTFMQSAQSDFARGAAITMTIGFLVTATSLLITQASATIERAEQSRALYRLGAPRGFDLRVMWLEIFVPIVASTVIGMVFGIWAALPVSRLIREAGLDHGDNSTAIVLVVVGGLVLAALALLASHPLHRRVLAGGVRRPS